MANRELVAPKYLVTRDHRERLNGHSSFVVWFTGLSGSGKSTLANAMEQAFHESGIRTYMLDGDVLRHGLNQDLGFSDRDRHENIRRVAHLASVLMDAGIVVLTAFISPFRAERALARSLVPAGKFIEVFVDCPLSICEQRDPKGLYRKARLGLVPQFTGIDSPYEAPLSPEIAVNTGELTIDESTELLTRHLRQQGLI